MILYTNTLQQEFQLEADLAPVSIRKYVPNKPSMYYNHSFLTYMRVVSSNRKK